MLERFNSGTAGFLRKANALIDLISRGIIAESPDIIQEQQANGQVLLALRVPIPEPPPSGNFVLTSQDGELTWEEIQDCPS